MEQNWNGMPFALLFINFTTASSALILDNVNLYEMISPKSFNFKIQHDTFLNLNQNCGSSDVLIIHNLQRQRDALNRFRDVGFESHHKHPLTAAPSERWETSRHVCSHTFPAWLCPPIYPLSHIAPRSQHIHCRVSGPQWSQTFWLKWQRQALFCPASKSVWFLSFTVL